VKIPVNVFATLRSPKVVSRKVFSPLFICVEARTISPVPLTVVHLSPVASAESAVRTCPLDHTASREAVLAPVQPARSHLASHIASVATDPPPEITISPLPRSVFPFTVFMFVQDTSVSCFPARADVLALSVLRLAKFVFTCHLNDAPVIQSFNVVIVDMVLN